MTTRTHRSIARIICLAAMLAFGCDKPPSASNGVAAVDPQGASDLKWWAITNITPNGNLDCQIYAFGRGDFVYEGTPRADARTAEDLRRLDPQHVGTVTKEGNTQTFHFPGQPDKTPGGVMQELVAVPSAKFDGTYSVSNTSNFGGVAAAGGNIWTFHADGTFQHETFGGVSSTPHVTGTGSAPGNAAGVSDHIEHGTYAFSPGTLTLTADGGAGTETHTAWNIGNHTPPWYIEIDGLTFKGSS